MINNNKIKKGAGFIIISLCGVFFIQVTFNLLISFGQNFLASLILVILILSPFIINFILARWFRGSAALKNLRAVIVLSLTLDYTCIYLLMGYNVESIISSLNLYLF